MPLTLYVDGPRWREHLAATAATNPGLVPVAKGNGYGFTVGRLARRAEWLGVDTSPLAPTPRWPRSRSASPETSSCSSRGGPSSTLPYDPTTVDPHRRPRRGPRRAGRPRRQATGRLEALTSMTPPRFRRRRRSQRCPRASRRPGRRPRRAPPARNGPRHRGRALLARPPAARRWFVSHLPDTTSWHELRGAVTPTWSSGRASERRCGSVDREACRRAPRCSTRTQSSAATWPATGSGNDPSRHRARRLRWHCAWVALEAPTAAATSRQRAVARPGVGSRRPAAHCRRSSSTASSAGSSSPRTCRSVSCFFLLALRSPGWVTRSTSRSASRPRRSTTSRPARKGLPLLFAQSLQGRDDDHVVSVTAVEVVGTATRDQHQPGLSSRRIQV